MIHADTRRTPHTRSAWKNAVGWLGREHRLARALAIALAASLWTVAASAHPLAPALLELTERPGGEVEVLWKRSSLSVPGSNIQPILPEACPSKTRPTYEEQGVAVLVRWTLDCGSAGLVGQPVRIDGLGPAKIDTLVRIQLADGRQIQRVLRQGEPSMLVPARASRWTVFVDYLSVGFGHILSGPDHLLFVFGLFLLCATTRPLIQTITSFTVGHSVTLSLAALGYAQFPPGPIEFLIAASVLLLAVELARDASKETLMRRYPWPMALLFGLLHGMGFAGALREIGLPQGEIPMALFSFNVGIELGQLVFVVGLVLVAWVIERLPMPIPVPRRVAVYAMGSMAAFWTFERVAAIL